MILMDFDSKHSGTLSRPLNRDMHCATNIFTIYSNRSNDFGNIFECLRTSAYQAALFMKITHRLNILSFIHFSGFWVNYDWDELNFGSILTDVKVLKIFCMKRTSQHCCILDIINSISSSKRLSQFQMIDLICSACFLAVVFDGNKHRYH